MNEETNLVDTLTGVLKNTHVTTDNVRVDGSISGKIIQKAKLSFLIFTLFLGKIVNYLKSSGAPHLTIFGRPLYEPVNKANRMIFKLPYPIDYEKTVEYADHVAYHFKFTVTEFYIPGSESDKDDFRQEGPIRFVIAPNTFEFTGGREAQWVLDFDFQCLTINEKLKEFMAKNELFDLFAGITPYNTIESASHFFNVSSAPYASIGSALGGHRPDIFFEIDGEAYLEMLKEQNPNRKEAFLIEKALNQIVLEHNPNMPFYQQYGAINEGWLKQVFDFRDESGFVVMKVYKTYRYDVQGSMKFYLPVTKWQKNGEPSTRYLTMPLPAKQILFNLHKFKDAVYVVICSDIETADMYQKNCKDPQIVFSAFLCDYGCYDEVDFSPLKGKHILLLIQNHSGLTLAETFREVNALYEYLKMQKMDHISFIQCAVTYHEYPNFMSISELLDLYDSHTKPAVIEDSVIFMETEADFQEYFEKAQNEIERKQLAFCDKPFWSKDEASEPVPVKETPSSPMGEVLFHPFIWRGNITYFMGQKGIGKSALFASISARMVNNSERAPKLFAECGWAVPKFNGGIVPKIVILDFENGQVIINRRKKEMMAPYLFKDKETPNLIVKDMTSDTTNYSDEAHFDDFCRMLDEIAANEGIKGQPIDLLCIDTYWTFCQKKDMQFNIFTKLISRYPKMAIVVMHHLGGDGNVYGRKDKTFACGARVYLSRKEMKPGQTLADPIDIGLDIRSNAIPELTKPFTCKFEKSEWSVCNPEHTPAEMARIICQENKQNGITKEETAKLLGKGITQFDALLKKK